MSIPTEPIGSLPRPRALQEALARHAEGKLPEAELTNIQDRAVADTLNRLEQLGCPVLVDGDQAKPSSLTYPLTGLTTLDPTASPSPTPTATPVSSPA